MIETHGVSEITEVHGILETSDFYCIPETTKPYAPRSVREEQLKS
jgi:hypothetical protein